MEINFWGYKIRVNRSKKRSQFSLSDAQAINDDRVAELKQLSHDELKARRDEVTVEGIDDDHRLKTAQSTLAKCGILIIPNFLDQDKVQKFSDTLYQAYKRKLFQLQGDHYEDEDVLVQRGASKVPGYHKRAEYPKPIVQVRQGQDQGMVDIFNADALVPEFAQEVREPFERDSVLSLLQGKSAELTAHNLNCYINQGIRRTRGFHADSYSEELKGFIYLTDVESLEDGPYAYVKGSHVETPYRRANQKLSDGLPNQTEAPLVDQSAVVPVLARRGALVISDQAGFHRGIPQGPDGYRMIAVMNYK